MLNKIFKIVIVFFIFISVSFAETTIKLKTDKTSYDIGEKINLSILINTDLQNLGLPSINGIDDFNIVGQSTRSSIQSINGEINNNLTLSLILEANTIGNFSIGPAELKIGSGSLKSNTLDINVDFTNKENKNNNTFGSGNNKEDNNKEVTKKEKEDIYGVKNNLFFGSDYFIYYFFLFLFFIFISYFILNKYFSKKIEKKEIVEKEIIPETTLILKDLKNLEKKANDYLKSEFYSELNTLFRRYFNYLGLDLSYKLSLKELEKNRELLGDKLLILFKQSYFLEFGGGKEKLDNRKELIKSFIKYLK